MYLTSLEDERRTNKKRVFVIFILFFLTVIIIVIVAFSVKRRKTRHELFASILFALMMNFVTDLYLDIKYHLYWYFDKRRLIGRI